MVGLRTLGKDFFQLRKQVPILNVMYLQVSFVVQISCEVDLAIYTFFTILFKVDKES